MRRASSLSHLQRTWHSWRLHRTSLPLCRVAVPSAASFVSSSSVLRQTLSLMPVRGPSYSRSQSMASQAASTTSTAECVEDSEPERMERRLQGKTRKKPRVKAKPPPVVAATIELTDSDSSSHKPAQSPRHQIASTALIIDISGMSLLHRCPAPPKDIARPDDSEPSLPVAPLKVRDVSPQTHCPVPPIKDLNTTSDDGAST